MKTISIVGLPNVGKSTIFNKLTGRKNAIANNTFGVTRDRKEETGKLSNLKFKIIDTGGMDKKIKFSSLVTEQIKISIEKADIILFIIDAKTPLNQQNQEFAKWLHKTTDKPIILVANKCESYKKCYEIDQILHFNFIGPVYISAEHNLGFTDLYDVLSPLIPEETTTASLSIKKIKISIIGQPNSGKSTFVNQLLGQNRVIVSPEPGTTRDAIDISYNHKEHEIILVDTAGIRKKAKVVENIEYLSVKDSLSSIKKSHIVILMIDSTLEINQQDLAISEVVIKEGKGLIIALNKWDLIPKHYSKTLLQKVQQYNKLHIKVPIIAISALNNFNCSKVIDKAIELYHLLHKRIPTSLINKWLTLVLEDHKHPLKNGKKVKLKYITQIKSMPPTFLVSSNNIENIDATYQKYLINSLRQNFSLEGIPIRLNFKKSKNPYAVN